MFDCDTANVRANKPLLPDRRKHIRYAVLDLIKDTAAFVKPYMHGVILMAVVSWSCSENMQARRESFAPLPEPTTDLVAMTPDTDKGPLYRMDSIIFSAVIGRW